MVSKLPRIKSRMDYSLVVITLLLVVIGLLMVFSASYYVAMYSSLYDGDSFHFVKSQMKWAGAGLVIMIALSFLDYHKLRLYGIPWIGIIITVVLLGWVLIDGIIINGARRWIQIGSMQFQPVEFLKPAVVLFMAHTLSKYRRFNKKLWAPLPYLLLMGGIFLLLILQPNYSSGFDIVMLVFIMLFFGGTNIYELIVIGAVGGYFGYKFIQSTAHGLSRLTGFIEPFKSHLGDGYQLIQSWIALSNGGLFGKGLGMSRQKFMFLPYAETDFIFAIWGEEFGYVGSILLMFLFLILIWRGIVTAINSRDMFGSLLAGGITAMISFQTIIHLLVVTGNMPTTGLPLPFVSFGGTAMFVFMACMGILLNISKQSRPV